ncbi:MAG TPA: ABC transporter ATP-binding protein [Trinickia sp.]|jgi:iron(III) transport system ATP-binding protein|nr:ABC transporter ATP-binding protein [Trinickia sp.]
MSNLSIRGLWKAFNDRPVLSGVDLSVNSGALLALLGPSGSGKTTLLRTVCGFEHADRGTVTVDGRCIAGEGVHVRAEARRIGYVSQEGSLFPHLSVAQNVVFGLPYTQRRAGHRVAELLELVGLPAWYAERPPQELSGGQQQRVALARALAPSPTLVMLDEPFSSLDAALRAETRQAVANALAHAGATAVLVTHDQSEALSMGHEVAVLWNGRMIQTATPDTLYRRPISRELAAFIGEAVLLPGTAASGGVICELGRLKLAVPVKAGAVDVMVRPEQVRVAPVDHRHRAYDDAVEATVEEITFYGHDATLALRLAQASNRSLRSAIRARVPGYSVPPLGARVQLSVEGEVIAYPR